MFYANCTSRNVLYILACAGCGEQYVGETGRTLRDRVTLHRQHINHPEYRTLVVSKHIKMCGKGFFTISPFYSFRNDNVTFRKCKEKYFIEKFQTTLNHVHL